MKKIKVYLTILSDQVKFGNYPAVLFKDPRTYLNYNADEIFVEEKTIEIPEEYEVAKTKMEETKLFKGNEICDAQISYEKDSIRVSPIEQNEMNKRKWEKFFFLEN